MAFRGESALAQDATAMRVEWMAADPVLPPFFCPHSHFITPDKGPVAHLRNCDHEAIGQWDAKRLFSLETVKIEIHPICTTRVVNVAHDHAYKLHTRLEGIPKTPPR